MKKYCKIYLLSAAHTLKNYPALLGLGLFLLVCLVIFANIWEVIASKTQAIHLSASQLLWYIALNEWVLISLPQPEREMEVDLKSGKLAYLLPKPISYLGRAFMGALGAYTVNLCALGLVGFSFVFFRVGLVSLPVSSIVIMLGMGIAAGVIAILFQMLIGVMAFWVHEVEPFKWFWDKLLFALGGLMLPLVAYPKVLQQIAYYTPFPWILGGRSALVIDYSFDRVADVAFGLVTWAVVVAFGIVLLYRQGLKALQLQGG